MFLELSFSVSDFIRWAFRYRERDWCDKDIQGGGGQACPLQLTQPHQPQRAY